MSSVQHLREFISARLTAAAEEIFTEFEKTIVQYEEEIDRQRRLLDVTWKPQMKLTRMKLPQYFHRKDVPSDSGLDPDDPEPAPVKDEELLSDQLLGWEEKDFGPDQEPEAAPVKEEEEFCMSTEEELHVLKTETFIATPTDDENKQRDHGELELNCDQFLSQNPPLIEALDKDDVKLEESGSARSEEVKPERECNSRNVDRSSPSESPCGPGTGTKPILCDVCGKAFKHRCLLKNHYRTHTGERPFSCKTCGKSFTQARVLKVHMRTHTNEIFTCSTCSKTFKSENSLKIHEGIHTGEKPYSCKICGKGFLYNHLTQHMRVHTGERPYSCKLCGKTFSLNDSLKGHMRTHTDEKPFPCKVCGKRFKGKSTLRIHEGRHTGKKPYSCKICGKCFASNELSKHMRIHTGERPYCCKVCGKRFTQSGGLNEHMRTHSDDKPFPCEICGRRFAQKTHVTSHMRTHTGETPYSCETCGKRFRYSNGLTEHMRIHSGQRPYICSICGKSFVQSSQLNGHLRMHANERPHPCHLCTKRFRRRYDLNVHMETHLFSVLASSVSLTSEEVKLLGSVCECVSATMSSVQHLREFISARLTAAAEEIFTEFEKTIVQYEEEIDRQRRLLDVTWKPQKHLHAADLPPQFDCKEEEVLADQQLCNQEKNSSLDQEKPEPPQIKEELEEPCTSQDGEQLALKEETDALMVTVHFDGMDLSEAEPNRDQLLFQDFPAAENQTQEGGQPEELGSARNTEFFHSYVTDAAVPKTRCNTAAKKSVQCDVCGKTFKHKHQIKPHYRIHTGEKPYSCEICGASFAQSGSFYVHMRTHTGEYFQCSTCGKKFKELSHLKTHKRTHTGEKPYSCQICGKSFRHSGTLTVHMRTHTHEKPYTCEMCGKGFNQSTNLLTHMRTHTGEKPYSCQICGKSFRHRGTLTDHMITHTDEKPYSCHVCGRSFRRRGVWTEHMTTHSADNTAGDAGSS
ncbi:zinc finger protein 665-like [Melanotaenia boesemani]|uniref:zinc finger protein 665-like n=1 Tax=Melanotaenia boesemani TaxID=1250792 RepID=UPI001C041B4A|nr:zinc finger protein 665-like [Melanotaenia boesemani]